MTTSYVSPAMLELDQAAKEAGITVMNEIGLGNVSVPRFVYQSFLQIRHRSGNRPSM